MRRKFMQKAFDFFMQIIQRLFKPELSNGEREESFKIYASQDSTNKEVGIKTLEAKKKKSLRAGAETKNNERKFFRAKTCDKLVSKHQWSSFSFCCATR